MSTKLTFFLLTESAASTIPDGLIAVLLGLILLLIIFTYIFYISLEHSWVLKYFYVFIRTFNKFRKIIYKNVESLYQISKAKQQHTTNNTSCSNRFTAIAVQPWFKMRNCIVSKVSKIKDRSIETEKPLQYSIHKHLYCIQFISFAIVAAWQ